MGLSGAQRGSLASLLAPLLQGNGERAASSARFNYAPACFIKSYAESLCFVSFVTHTVTGTWTSWCIQVHLGKSILEWQLRMSRTGTFLFFFFLSIANKQKPFSFFLCFCSFTPLLRIWCLQSWKYLFNFSTNLISKQVPNFLWDPCQEFLNNN